MQNLLVLVLLFQKQETDRHPSLLGSIFRKRKDSVVTIDNKSKKKKLLIRLHNKISQNNSYASCFLNMKLKLNKNVTHNNINRAIYLTGKVPI